MLAVASLRHASCYTNTIEKHILADIACILTYSLVRYFDWACKEVYMK